MVEAGPNALDDFPLTDEQRMLLRIRDTLYEGSWEDFVRDLQARAQGRKHVFETVTDSPCMKATIASHMVMIDNLRAWEARHGRSLSCDGQGGAAA
jgi:hypothetical protein